jgi:hypothetical protein
MHIPIDLLVYATAALYLAAGAWAVAVPGRRAAHGHREQRDN